MSLLSQIPIALTRILAAVFLFMLTAGLGRVYMAETFAGKADVCYNAGDAKSASLYYNKALSVCQFKAQYYIDLSRAVLAKNSFSYLSGRGAAIKEATALLVRALELDPSSSIVYFNLARLEFSRMRVALGHRVDGDMIFDLVMKAVRNDPNNAELIARMYEFLYSVYDFIRSPENKRVILEPYIKRTFKTSAGMTSVLTVDILPFKDELAPCTWDVLDRSFYRVVNGRPTAQDLRLKAPFFVFCPLNRNGGMYRLTFSGRSDKARSRYGFLAVFWDDKLIDIIYVDSARQPRHYYADIEVKTSGRHLLTFRFMNDIYDPDLAVDRNIELSDVRLEPLF